VAGGGSDGTRGGAARSQGSGSRGRAPAGWDGQGRGAAAADEIEHVDTDWLARARPALVVAPPLHLHPAALAQLRRAGAVGPRGESLWPGVRVLQVDAGSLWGALGAVRAVGEAAGAGDAARALEGQLRDRLLRAARGARRGADKARPGAGPRVLLLRAAAPLLVGGEWRPELVTLAGGTPLLRPGDASEWASWEAVRAFAPEVIVLAADAAPGGDDGREGFKHLAGQRGWWDLPAVVSSAVFILGGAPRDLVNRPGPRLGDAVEALAYVLGVAAGDKPRGCAVLPRNTLFKLALNRGGRVRSKNIVHFFSAVRSQVVGGADGSGGAWR